MVAAGVAECADRLVEPTAGELDRAPTRGRRRGDRRRREVPPAQVRVVRRRARVGDRDLSSTRPEPVAARDALVRPVPDPQLARGPVEPEAELPDLVREAGRIDQGRAAVDVDDAEGRRVEVNARRTSDRPVRHACFDGDLRDGARTVDDCADDPLSDDVRLIEERRRRRVVVRRADGRRREVERRGRRRRQRRRGGARRGRRPSRNVVGPLDLERGLVPRPAVLRPAGVGDRGQRDRRPAAEVDGQQRILGAGRRVHARLRDHHEPPERRRDRHAMEVRRARVDRPCDRRRVDRVGSVARPPTVAGPALPVVAGPGDRELAIRRAHPRDVEPPAAVVISAQREVAVGEVVGRVPSVARGRVRLNVVVPSVAEDAACRVPVGLRDRGEGRPEPSEKHAVEVGPDARHHESAAEDGDVVVPAILRRRDEARVGRDRDEALSLIVARPLPQQVEPVDRPVDEQPPDVRDEQELPAPVRAPQPAHRDARRAAAGRAAAEPHVGLGREALAPQRPRRAAVYGLPRVDAYAAGRREAGRGALDKGEKHRPQAVDRHDAGGEGVAESYRRVPDGNARPRRGRRRPVPNPERAAVRRRRA